jgi:hypothetical protein
MEFPMSRLNLALTLPLSFLLLVVNSTAFGSSFKAAGNYAVGNHPVAVAAGDFNGDGSIDLAVANSASKTVSVLLGNGDGTFAKAADYDIGVVPGALAVTDFNGDGRADIVVGEAGGTRISVLLGSGAGDFETHVEVDINQAPPELVGRLKPQPSQQSGTQTASVVFADFNGDGQADEAVTLSGRNLVSVLLNVTDGSKAEIDLIKNGGFETGALLPWLPARKQYCSAPCKEWAVTTTDPWQGLYDAWDTGNLELRQNFHATETSSISSVVLWVRHPAGVINTAIDFFYSNGVDDEFIVDTSDSNWDSFDITGYLAAGESLEGLSVWGYNQGTGSVTYVDGVEVLASN